MGGGGEVNDQTSIGENPKERADFEEWLSAYMLLKCDTEQGGQLFKLLGWSLMITIILESWKHFGSRAWSLGVVTGRWSKVSRPIYRQFSIVQFHFVTYHLYLQNSSLRLKN